VNPRRRRIRRKERKASNLLAMVRGFDRYRFRIVKHDVYAFDGISPERLRAVRRAGRSEVAITRVVRQ